MSFNSQQAMPGLYVCVREDSLLLLGRGRARTNRAAVLRYGSGDSAFRYCQLFWQPLFAQNGGDRTLEHFGTRKYH